MQEQPCMHDAGPSNLQLSFQNHGVKDTGTAAQAIIGARRVCYLGCIHLLKLWNHASFQRQLIQRMLKTFGYYKYPNRSSLITSNIDFVTIDNDWCLFAPWHPMIPLGSQEISFP